MNWVVKAQLKAFPIHLSWLFGVSCTVLLGNKSSSLQSRIRSNMSAFFSGLRAALFPLLKWGRGSPRGQMAALLYYRLPPTLQADRLERGRATLLSTRADSSFFQRENQYQEVASQVMSLNPVANHAIPGNPREGKGLRLSKSGSRRNRPKPILQRRRTQGGSVGGGLFSELARNTNYHHHLPPELQIFAIISNSSRVGVFLGAP